MDAEDRRIGLLTVGFLVISIGYLGGRISI